MTAARYLVRWLPATLWVALIWLASAQRGFSAPPLIWDKAAHALAYLVLGLLCLWGAHGGLRPLRARATLLALALGLAYGVVDELHQSWVPGRDPSVHDWVADVVGVGAAIALFAAGERVRSVRTPLGTSGRSR